MQQYSKYLLFFLLMFVFACGDTATTERKIPADVVTNPLSGSGPGKLGELPGFEFSKTEHDFGRVYQGEKISYAFKFKNTGGSDLLISKVSAGCGCTVADYPHEAIKPGEESAINITFNSEGRQGFQSKSITVLANTQPNMIKLSIKAMVVTEKF